MAEPQSWEGLDRLALALLVGSPYSVDGVPTPLVAATWPSDGEHSRRAGAVCERVVGMVGAGQVSLLDVRYASDRATAAATRPIPVHEIARDAVRLVPPLPVDPAAARGDVPHLFAEEALDLLMWPDGASAAPDGEGRQRLIEDLGRLHALSLAASAVGGPAADLDVDLLALLDVLASARFVGAEPPDPAVSSVMLLLSAVAGAGEADVLLEAARVLTFLAGRTGWVPSAKPWASPAELIGADAWLTCR